MSNVGSFLHTPQAIDVARYSDKFPMSATQYIRKDGGRFVTNDTSAGTYILSIATSAQLDGWVDECFSESASSNPNRVDYITTSATGGATSLSGTKDIFGPNKAVWMTVGSGTAAATDIGKKLDLAISGSTTTTKQYVNLSGTTYQVVKVLDVDLINNLVLVCAVQKPGTV